MQLISKKRIKIEVIQDGWFIDKERVEYMDVCKSF